MGASVVRMPNWPEEDARLQRQAVRMIRLSVGGLLLLVGVIGGFVPVLQGWLFILAGLSVMAPESPTARRTLDWAREKLHGKSHRNP